MAWMLMGQDGFILQQGRQRKHYTVYICIVQTYYTDEL